MHAPPPPLSNSPTPNPQPPRLAESSAQARVLAGSAGPGGDGVLEVNVMKFICKEFWTEIFRKQIDKLQTNNQVGGRGAVCWWLGVLEAN